MNPEESEVCGESHDPNDLRLVDDRDGWASYECRTCGTEIVTEAPDEDEDEEDAR